MRNAGSTFAAAVVAVGLAACGNNAQLPLRASFGPRPTLPPPNPETISTVAVAPAAGWPAGAKPVGAPGTEVTAFATALEHPRWLTVLPNGDVLVAETSAPPQPEDKKGIKGFFMKLVLAKVGAGVPSANRITLLRDTDDDGVADVRSVFLEDLSSPFGMALVGDIFYVANADALVRVPYRTGETRIDADPEPVVELPGGPINHHWTKNVIASPDGRHLYVAVGSNSNVAENGMTAEYERAAILLVDPKTRMSRVFASGLRNPVGMTWEPKTGALWVAVNERDDLGGDLVPDYMTTVRDGGFYGWPYSYFGQHVDERVKPPRPDLVARAIVPDYALGAHTASLGLAFSEKNALPPAFRRGMFVGQHGSWNRKPLAGYQVVFVPFDANGRPDGEPREVLTGFVGEDGEARGRPVGVAIDGRGGLLVADDVGNTVWRVSGATSRAAKR